LTQKNTSSKFRLLLTWAVGKNPKLKEVYTMNVKSTKAKNQVTTVNIFEQQE